MQHSLLCAVISFVLVDMKFLASFVHQVNLLYLIFVGLF